jgi:uncharacterized protein YkwD
MKKIILIGIFLTFTWASTFFLGVQVGMRGTEARYKELAAVTPNYNGQQIQEAINQYRQSLGLVELKTDSILCNNLYDRYAKMLSEDALTEGHPGFDEWADEKINNYGYSLVGEVFSPMPTVEKVMEGWSGSPGHNLAITNKVYDKVCTYAGNRGVVVVLGAK